MADDRAQPSCARRAAAGILFAFVLLAVGTPPPATASTRVYAVNSGFPDPPMLSMDTISVIDPFTNTVIETFPVPAVGIGLIAAAPDGSRVYVDAATPDGVTVIDTASNTVLTTVPLPDIAGDMVVLPDSSRLYVRTGLSLVSVIDTATNTVSASIPVGFTLGPLAVDPDGSRVFVSRTSQQVPADNGVAVIDTATDTVVDLLPIAEAGQLAVCAQITGDQLYVAHRTEASLRVIDADDGALLALLPLSNPPGRIVFSTDPSISRAYIATGTSNQGSGRISIAETVSQGVIGTVAVGKNINDLAITPDGRLLYTSSGTLDRVSVVDVYTEREIERVAVGDIPFGLAVVTAPACGDAYLDVGEGCDDGNLSNGDGCTALCEIDIACPPSPDPACLAADRASLVAKDVAAPLTRRLAAKFSHAPALSQTDLGNPLAPARTAYALCLYDGAGVLVEELLVDRALDFCVTDRPCWSALGGAPPGGRGYRLVDPVGGIDKMLLQGGAAGRSKVMLKGRNNLQAGLPVALQNVTSVTMQWRSSDGPVCLSATLPAITRQSATLFKARTS